MPGILPMKVIKVGCSAASQSRIAQACDRCRSKKIRCDGLAPTCTQCSNVGFECKTSDKLSRRAFPRGYTESLEERVRALEGEVRELKDLLDEKDEKIDMLSKLHSSSSSSSRKTSTSPFATPHMERSPRVSIPTPREETFKIHQPPFLIGDGEDAYFIGPSSGRALIDSFKKKLQEAGNPSSAVETDLFFPPYERSRTWLLTGTQQSRDVAVAPPRLLSDQLVNIFFQEWAPLFPILHRPTFLSQYEQYVSNTSTVTDRRVLTQLNLVFGIAALSQTGQLRSSVEQYEKRWSAAMEGIMLETSVASLQCILLALVHAMLSASPMKLLHFRSRAVGMSQRLGLHLCQKRFPLGALTNETRKRIFWTLYTLDSFAAATFGLPRLLVEADIHCEYPVDADDEYVTEEGFMPTMPGACTKLSSALALFRCSRVLAKVLEENYPASASHELSLSKIQALDAELEAWQETLAPHLRMEFVQDKPSTNVVSSRSPLLSLTYHYIRTLIHRPAICGSLGEKASPSMVCLASSSKRIVQLVQLLDERKLNFSLCMNKDELLIVSGFGLLFQAMSLNKDGKFLKDVSRMVSHVADMLETRHAPGAGAFRGISECIIPSMSTSVPAQVSSKPSAGVTTTTRDVSVQTQKQLQALAAKTNIPKKSHSSHRGSPPEFNQRPVVSPEFQQNAKRERPTPPTISVSNDRRPSIDLMPRRSSSESDTKAALKQALQKMPPSPAPVTRPNLDYLPFTTAPPSAPAAPQAPIQKPVSKNQTAVWDPLLGGFNDVKADVHDHQAYYDNTTMGAMTAVYPMPGSYLQVPAISSGPPHTWSPSQWAYNLEQMHLTPNMESNAMFSYAEESLTSGEDFSSIDASSNGSDLAFSGLMLPSFPHETFNHLERGEHQDFGNALRY